MDVEIKEVGFKDIFKEVCRYYNVTMLDVISARRTARIVLARHMIINLALQHTRLNMNSLASRLNRSRWTILASRDKVLAVLDKQESFISDTNKLKQRLGLT